jgi:hypothetical protein
LITSYTVHLFAKLEKRKKEGVFGKGIADSTKSAIAG